MNKTHILALSVAVALASAAAFAQTAATPAAGGKARVQLDANKDGAIDRAEAAKLPRLAQKFDALDKNKDGKLSRDERPMHRGKHRSGGRGMGADADKDGRISRAEMQASQAKHAQKFEQMDVNKDGYLDRADREARAAKWRAEFFAGADANRDGRITRDEYTVEQAARSAERREQWAKRTQAAGHQLPARAEPTEAQKIQRATARFDRMDANKDGVLTRAEFDASKSMQRGQRKGGGRR